MAINLSSILTRVKVDLGIYGLVLPIENADEEMANIIKDISLATYSNFFPDVSRVSIDIKDLVCLQNLYQESIYIIPDVFGGREILSIRKINPRSLLLSGGYYAPYIDSSPELYMGMMMAQANADLISAAAPAFTYRFAAPNKVHLFNITTMYGILDIEFNLEHADNLSTVKKTQYDTFYELVSLDIKNFLYGSLKHFRNIQTAYGTITLDVDDWATAANDRKDLVEKWRDVYHLEQEQMYII
jgi:hypothetical protein